MADDKVVPETEKKEGGSSTDTTDRNTEVKSKKKKGILSRIWNGLFRSRGDDFEKRLQYISKEEVTILTRMKRRAMRWRHTCRNLILLSVALEVIAVGYAIMTTRSVDLEWRMRAFRVLPMFLLPALSSAAYFGLANFNRICERKDQKTLERLRAERQAKIDELKEKTNYYITQQLIQRYDTDPAAKAAAATVLASKLGIDSGIKVSVGDESNINAATGKSNDVEHAQSTGLRNRRQVHNRSSGAGTTQMHGLNEQTPNLEGTEGFDSEHDQLVVDHYQPQGPVTHDGGWLARLAALLVGEDPTQSYALICGNCHMHNGLARKEDFPFITYYCPHCHALNGPKQLEEQLDPVSPDVSLKAGDSTPNATLRAGSSIHEVSLGKGSSTPDASLKAGSSTDVVDNAGIPESDSEPTNSTMTEAKPEMEEEKEVVAVASGNLDG